MSTRSRSTYHHGDLRNALLEAGITLAEAGGPDAVGVRSAARQVGVTPTAAYRHFADAVDLLREVKICARQRIVEAVEMDIGSLEPSDDLGVDAIRRLTATGRAYIRNGIDNPGLFLVSFGHDIRMPTNPGDTAFDILTTSLDDLVTAGFMDPDRRPGAPVLAWAAVHGCVRLVLDGPLSVLPPDDMVVVRENVLELVVRGLGRPDSPLYPRIRDIMATGSMTRSR